MFGFLEKKIRTVKVQWHMGCVSSKVPDIIGEGYRLKVKKTVAVGGSAKIMEVDPGGGKATMIVKKIVAFNRREKERVKLEAELYRKLEDNQFVIDLVAHITEDVNHYFLFERFPINFADYLESLRKEETVDELKHLKYFSGLVSAIEQLHSYGYSHMDLKPANILKNDDVIKLIDFGSATKMLLQIESSADHHKYREEAEERCSMMYRAPELFSCDIGSTLTTAVDVWSLGVCLYDFMYLENPFDKVYEQGGSIALATQSPQMIKWDGKSVSKKTVDLIKSLMVVEPENRPSAEELRKKMEDLVKNWGKPEEPGANETPIRELTDEEFDRAMRETT
ncbi:unnamed protein product [Caenorhabditis sp. 36 PRJEB53466]|nr:unnamed protein product [Caenorhabditis sp. 36 PRJEB53466]